MDNNKVPEQDKKVSNSLEKLKARAEKDPIASFLKMELTELSPGYAKIVMKLVPEHLNFDGLVFGGIIMSLADQAFGYAVNSAVYPSYAAQFNIHFTAAARAGDTLTAEGRLVRSGRRVGLAEMTVTNQEGKLIARATGTTIPVS